jgi:PKD repeat protein
VRIPRLARCAIAILPLAVLLIATTSDLARAQDMAMPDASPTPSGRVMIPEPLLVSLQAVPGYGTSPMQVGFIVNALDPSGAEIVSYNWNFGDGHTSTEQPLQAYNTYLQPGSYVATVTISTADGRSATGFTGIIVKPALGGTMQQRQQNQ